MKNPNTFTHKNGITIKVIPKKQLDPDRVAAFIIAFARWQIQQERRTKR